MTLCTGKWCIQKRIHNLKCKSRSHYTCTHGKNVRIVVKSRRLRAEAVSAQCCTDPLITVCGDRNANACAADQDTAVTSSLQDLFYHLFGVNRIIHGVFGVCTTVDILKPSLIQVFFYFLHQTVAGLVTPQC